MGVKILCLNIEGDRHLEKVVPFLKEQNPDIICLLECFKVNVPFFEKELNLHGFFFAQANKLRRISERDVDPKGYQGIAVFTKLDVNSVSGMYYTKGNIPEYSGPNGQDRVLAFLRVEKEGKEYSVAATHFTWAANGGTNNEQSQDLKAMLELIKDEELILCGDFNAPRGGEIFTALSMHFKDNIPVEVETTIDQNLHKVKGLMYVVDGLFSTPSYDVKNVQVIDGVSDHKALAADIERN